jgi:PEGA domain/PDZ domain
VCALLLTASGLAGFQNLVAQESHKPLSEKEIIDLLTNDVPPPRVAELAKQYGISFVMTATTEQTLRDAGATGSLLEALRQLAPKTVSPAVSQPPAANSSPPVLLIESSPGDAQVYIDDEPVGTTSPEGRLKLSKLGAGEHRVRVAHAGFTDFEQTVTLSSGPATVSAKLETKAQAPPAENPLNSGPPAQQPAQPAGSAQTAVLGMSIRSPEVGARGALVVALVPNGPAERAGIRPGYAILSVNGKSIMTPQELVQSTVGHSPGDVFEVKFSNGAQVATASVTLAGPSIFQTIPHFRVAHDHGPPVPNYCVGTMWILDGMISYVGQVGVNASGKNGTKHNFEFTMSDIREIRRNGFYMALLGAFHIRMKDGSVNNFIVEDEKGHYEPPEQLLNAVKRAMAKK